MYVIADVEWGKSFTQKKSNAAGSSTSGRKLGNCRKIFLFYPIDEFFYDWDHVAYKGGNPTDFKHAPPCYEVFKTFNEWCDDDVVCWWHTPSAHMHSFVNKVVLNTENTKQPIILCEYMPGFLNGEGVCRGSA